MDEYIDKVKKQFSRMNQAFYSRRHPILNLMLENG